MDKKILSGGEDVYVYFGPEHKISLSSNKITSSDTLTVTAQNYHYQDNTWIPLTKVNVGLTQPDPSNPYSPKEIKTSTVDTSGQAVFNNIDAGSYNIGIKEDSYFPTETLTVEIAPAEKTPETHSGNGSGGNYTIPPIIKSVFDSTKALNFLLAQQKADGSFGDELYTDWATLALISNSTISKINLDKLTNYLSKTKLSENILTNYERHTIALMALGLNPYNINNQNYIKQIVLKFDGKQFGDINADNDDIFALIVLQNSGYKQDDPIVSNTINFILSKQTENGSWDNSVDLTGASIEALSAFIQDQKVKDSIIKAEAYLKEKQIQDGSWGNVSSTAWAMEGILALGEKSENWIKNGNSPLDYLANNQDLDGGIKDSDLNNRIWQTSYVLASLSGKSWNQVMQKFDIPKTSPQIENILNNRGQNTFLKRINQFKKPRKLQKITELKANPTPIETKKSEPEKKQGFFKRILGKIFSF